MLQICNMHRLMVSLHMEQKALKASILEFLRENFIMNIAVCENDIPTSSVVVYHVDKDLNFYFMTHTDSYKAKKLQKNPHISLSIWRANEMLIQADGEAQEITDSLKRIDLIDRISEAAGQDPLFMPPILKISGDNYVVFKIKPTWLRRFDLSNDSATKTSSPFEQLEIK